MLPSRLKNRFNHHADLIEEDKRGQFFEVVLIIKKKPEGTACPEFVFILYAEWHLHNTASYP